MARMLVSFDCETGGIYIVSGNNDQWSSPTWVVEPTADYDSSYPSMMLDSEGYLRLSFRYWDHSTNRKIFWTTCRYLESAPNPDLLSISVTPVSPTIAPGQTQQFTAMAYYFDNSTVNLTPSVTWTSSNTGIAT